MNPVSIYSWLSRISLTIAFIIIIYIIVKNQRNQNNSSDISIKNPQYKRLRLSSTITFISCPICIIILVSRKLPFICKYTYPLVPISIISPHIFLSFYQLTRLQLAFSDNKPNINKNIAYPSWIFTILYIFGALLLPAITTYPYFLMEISDEEGYLGCTWKPKQYWTSINMVHICCYIIWDWIIVGLYIYKLHQFTKNLGDKYTNKGSEVLHEIVMILNKILFLTIIAEIIGLLITLPDILQISPWIGVCGHAIDVITVAMVLYLMMEHNSKDYFGLLTFMARYGCLKCCCCCFGDLASKMNKSIRLSTRKLNVNVNVKVQQEKMDDDQNNTTGHQLDNISIQTPSVEVIPNKALYNISQNTETGL